MSELFLVLAYRYGDLKSYHFPVGIFITFFEAQSAAKRHRKYRGAKYDHRIYLIPPGEEFDGEQCELVQDFLYVL
jgi:hypothetical protein